MQVSNVPSNFAASETKRLSNFKQQQQDFQALGKALQDGDLAGARQALAKLQQDFQNVRQAHQQPGAGVSQASNVGQVTPGHGTSAIGGQVNIIA
jgi:hypothetical protein